MNPGLVSTQTPSTADVALHRALLRELSRATGVALAFRSHPVPISGGFWAQIYGFELDHPPEHLAGPLVLRVMPDADSGRREIVVQSWLADAGYPVASVLCSGTADGLGEAFMVMPRIAGSPPLANLRLGSALLKLRGILRSIRRRLAEASTSLHVLDPAPLRHLLGPADAAAQYLGQVAAACGPTSSGFDALVRWFDDNRPHPTREVLCHGDLHPFNLLVDEHGRKVVLDWTGATIAPPEMDVGFTAALLRCAPIAVPRPIAPIIARVTNHLADTFVATCRSTEMLDDSALRWWEALQCARCLSEVVMARGSAVTALGQTHPFETAAPMMQRRLRQLTAVTVTLPPRRP